MHVSFSRWLFRLCCLSSNGAMNMSFVAVESYISSILRAGQGQCNFFVASGAAIFAARTLQLLKICSMKDIQFHHIGLKFNRRPKLGGRE